MAADYNTAETNFLKGIGGLVLLIIVLNFWNRTRLGHAVIYYVLVIIITGILLTQGTTIAGYIGHIADISGG